MTDSNKSLGGLKYDDGKLPLDLLSPHYLEATAAVLQFGAAKYAAYNWAKGMKWSRVYAALMRHLWKWWGGEKYDAETGMSHLWHASCCLMFLVHYEATGTGDNDKPAYTNHYAQETTKDKEVTTVEQPKLSRPTNPLERGGLRHVQADLCSPSRCW